MPLNQTVAGAKVNGDGVWGAMWRYRFVRNAQKISISCRRKSVIVETALRLYFRVTYHHVLLRHKAANKIQWNTTKAQV